MKHYLLAVTAALVAVIVAEPVVAQKSKDTLRFPLKAGESVLDQYLSTGPFYNAWAPAIYDGLLGFDPEKGEFLPRLAKSWAQPTPTTYEFELRDDLVWHDGQKVDADDVAYTLNYLIDPKVTLRFKSNWVWIKSVEKLGPYKVRVTAKQPTPQGLMIMGSDTTPIYPRHLHEPLANKLDFGARPVGTGPYRMVKIDKNTGIVAERNPTFKASAAKSPALVGRIVAEPIPEQGTLVAALLTGRADIAANLSADQTAALRESGRFEVTKAPPSVGYTFVGFPTAGWQNVKALSDVRVRTAIVKAIDRKALIEVTFGAFAAGIRPAEALCSKEQLGCGYTKMVPDYDPAGAKKLLAEAGYPDGFDVVISTLLESPNTRVQATAVSGMLRAVGIRATVNPHLTVARVQLINQGKVEIGFYGWSGGSIFDVSSQIVRHFLSKEYADADLTKMAAATFSIMDDAERRKAVAKAFDHATDNAYAFAMSPNRDIFIHTKEVKLVANREINAGPASVNEFGWK